MACMYPVVQMKVSTSNTDLAGVGSEVGRD